MGIRLHVEGENINFKLSDYEIRGYELYYKVQNSKYAKGYEDIRNLIITGDISRIVEKNKQILKLIREWAKKKYEDSTYYHKVVVTHSYKEEMVREIIFPNAFITSYVEDINPYTGHGNFQIFLTQKKDKRNEIVVNPFQEEIVIKNNF